MIFLKPECMHKIAPKVLLERPHNYLPPCHKFISNRRLNSISMTIVPNTATLNMTSQKDQTNQYPMGCSLRASVPNRVSYCLRLSGLQRKEATG